MKKKTTTPSPAKPLSAAALRRSLAAKGIPAERLSDKSLAELGVSRADLEAAPATAAKPAKSRAKKAPAAAPASAPEAAVKAEKAAPAKRRKASQKAAIAPAGPTAEPTLDGRFLPSWCDESKLVFKVRLDEPTPSNNELRHMHFAPYKKLRERFAAQVKDALGDTEPPKLEKAALYIVRYCMGEGLDWDNALGGLKPALDCLVAPSSRNPSGLHIVEDDNQKHMPFPPFMTQEKAPRGQGWTEIFVFRLP